MILNLFGHNADRLRLRQVLDAYISGPHDMEECFHLTCPDGLVNSYSTREEAEDAFLERVMDTADKNRKMFGDKE